MAVSIKITLSGMTPYSLVDMYQCYEGIFCLNLLGGVFCGLFNDAVSSVES
jgi:hypothetical protein